MFMSEDDDLWIQGDEGKRGGRRGASSSSSKSAAGDARRRPSSDGPGGSGGGAFGLAGDLDNVGDDSQGGQGFGMDRSAARQRALERQRQLQREKNARMVDFNTVSRSAKPMASPGRSSTSRGIRNFSMPRQHLIGPGSLGVKPKFGFSGFDDGDQRRDAPRRRESDEYDPFHVPGRSGMNGFDDYDDDSVSGGRMSSLDRVGPATTERRHVKKSDGSASSRANFEQERDRALKYEREQRRQRELRRQRMDEANHPTDIDADTVLYDDAGSKRSTSSRSKAGTAQGFLTSYDKQRKPANRSHEDDDSEGRDGRGRSRRSDKRDRQSKHDRERGRDRKSSRGRQKETYNSSSEDDGRGTSTDDEDYAADARARDRGSRARGRDARDEGDRPRDRDRDRQRNRNARDRREGTSDRGSKSSSKPRPDASRDAPHPPKEDGRMDRKARKEAAARRALARNAGGSKVSRGPHPPPRMEEEEDDDDDDDRGEVDSEDEDAPTLPSEFDPTAGGASAAAGGKTGSAANSASTSRSAAALPLSERTVAQLDLSDMRQFVTTPVPYDAGVVMCYIVRKKTGFRKMYPEYHLYLQDGDRFLLAAKKRAHQKTSNYLISMNRSDLSRKSSNFLGKLRSNFIGTEFVVFDDGMNPRDIVSSAGRKDNLARRELAICLYASNVLGSRGPRKMRACVPIVDRETGEAALFQPTGNNDGMVARFKQVQGARSDKLARAGLFPMINKPPRWNDQVGAYVLNFNGRVTMASVKNFQLIHPDEQERVVLQFGRIAKDKFTMDFMWPMTPLQAFSICLSSFDYKLACE